MNLRILSAALMAVAVSVLWMAASSASATTFTSPTETVYTGEIKAENEGHVVLDNPEANIECSSTLESKVESHGDGVTAGGNLSALSFTGCTGGWAVTVVTKGSLQIHVLGEGPNGTVTSSGATLTATLNLVFFHITCRYSTESTDIGTLTGGSNPTIHLEAAIPFHSGSGACGTEASNWTGSYKITTPSSLAVDQKEKVECEFMNDKKFGEYTTESECTSTLGAGPEGVWKRIPK